MSGDNRSAEEVRAEIAETRTELSQTAAALAAKTDVKAQVKQAAAKKTAQVRQTTAERTAQVKQAAHTATEKAVEKTAEAKQATAETTAKVTQAAGDQVAVAADTVRHQFTDGDATEVVRRPVPIAVIAAAALGIAAIITSVIRRRR
jgi:hypothetical protein